MVVSEQWGGETEKVLIMDLQSLGTIIVLCIQRISFPEETEPEKNGLDCLSI